MTITKNGRRRKKPLLSHGRPPNAHKAAPSMKSKATRRLINTTHQINKDLARAVATNDETNIARLKTHLDELGGLRAYQQASIQGQSNERGGDSSTVLLDFLTPLVPALVSKEDGIMPRLLEIGALSTTNACSRSGFFSVTRIDLHAQAPGIEQQDFMQRPLPQRDGDRFDVVSLSLVLNFVPTPEARGDMLKRTCAFLKPPVVAGPQGDVHHKPKTLENLLPVLFLVLPAPCLRNSRYLNAERFALMMNSLGYVLRNVKWTDRMYYSTWQLLSAPSAARQRFSKKQVNPGPGRNNFSIVLR